MERNLKFQGEAVAKDDIFCKERRKGQ